LPYYYDIEGGARGIERGGDVFTFNRMIIGPEHFYIASEK